MKRRTMVTQRRLVPYIYISFLAFFISTMLYALSQSVMHELCTISKAITATRATFGEF